MTDFAVLGDWGTTRLRLFRVERGAITGRLDGPGIGLLRQDAAAAFGDAVGPWLSPSLPRSITLCGMAGARDGWRETGYVACPATSDDWQAMALRFDWRGVPVAIMAGLADEGEDGVPDVMRGEETQIFGACRLVPALGTGRHILVLPGTHSKWALVEDGRVVAFRTIPTGEIFGLLRHHSTLCPARDTGDAAAQSAGFAEGLERGRTGRLLQSLFAARAMRLRAGRPDDWAAGYLSGLLIGCEFTEMRAMLGQADDIVLIGDATLAARYAQALEEEGIATRSLDADACALAGLGFMGDFAA